MSNGRHRVVLNQLMPLSFNGDINQEIDSDGEILDNIEDRAIELFNNIFPDTADELIEQWRELVAEPFPPDADLDTKRKIIIWKLRFKTGISRQFYIDFSCRWGYEIEITEYYGTMAWDKNTPEPTPNEKWHFDFDFLRAGDELLHEDAAFAWKVTVKRALAHLWRTWEEYEAEIIRLKPAHTHVFFVYEFIEPTKTILFGEGVIAEGSQLGVMTSRTILKGEGFGDTCDPDPFYDIEI